MKKLFLSNVDFEFEKDETGRLAFGERWELEEENV